MVLKFCNALSGATVAFQLSRFVALLPVGGLCPSLQLIKRVTMHKFFFSPCDAGRGASLGYVARCPCDAT